MLRKILVSAAVLVVLLSASSLPARAESDKIGFIDTQKILVAHPKYAEKQKYLDDFIAKKADEARSAAEKEQDAEKRMAIIDKARDESGREEMKVMNPITDEINKVIESVAKSKGVTVVMEKVYIFFGGTDLTDSVVKGVKAIK